ncbi:transforming growth factor beta regulator 1 [Hyalella azteca]|uniref:Transforming growth factor beta regulator 1 n=1 Tax=Hyalella azteca TaxID=294128 RepID=A0A8B7NEP8_HYAAZ|nr:transforming growth factor beta regulator 1 [Hyalella azteca]
MGGPKKSKMSSRGRGYLPPAVAAGLARHEAVQQQAYRTKYKQMKNIARSLVLENAALCDTVACVQQRIVLANEERRFLLGKYLSMSQESNMKDNPLLHIDAEALSALQSTGASLTAGSTQAVSKVNGSSCERPVVANSRKTKAQQYGRVCSRGGAGSGKSKRLCPPITLDSAGRPIFPIVLGPLTIHSLGEIVSDRTTYHRNHVIYPVGFCSSRTYASVRSPLLAATYTCKISEGGLAPRFEVVCEEPDTGEERVFCGRTPSECHNAVVDVVNASPSVPRGVLERSVELPSINDIGLRFFGLSHPSVQNVLQACPGARKCQNYQWIKFEVCRSEHEVEQVMESELDPALCHDTLLRNIMFASQAR